MSWLTKDHNTAVCRFNNGEAFVTVKGKVIVNYADPGVVDFESRDVLIPHDAELVDVITQDVVADPDLARRLRSTMTEVALRDRYN